MAILLGAAHGVALCVALEARDVVPALLGLGLGALAQDLLTGGVHWACDSWGDARTRWLGPQLIRWFREHHRDPQGIVARDWVWVNREPGILAGAVLALLWLPGLQAALAASPFVYAAVLAFAAYGGAANQIHQWAHRHRVPAPVRVAQRLGLLLSPDAHARHHQPPHRTAYCISTGWLNPWLDRWRVWAALERAVTRLTGAMPRRPRIRAGKMGRYQEERSSA